MAHHMTMRQAVDAYGVVLVDYLSRDRNDPWAAVGKFRQLLDALGFPTDEVVSAICEAKPSVAKWVMAAQDTSHRGTA